MWQIRQLSIDLRRTGLRDAPNDVRGVPDFKVFQRGACPRTPLACRPGFGAHKLEPLFTKSLILDPAYHSFHSRFCCKMSWGKGRRDMQSFLGVGGGGGGASNNEKEKQRKSERTKHRQPTKQSMMKNIVFIGSDTFSQGWVCTVELDSGFCRAADLLGACHRHFAGSLGAHGLDSAWLTKIDTF